MTRSRSTFEKIQKERARQEKQKEKAARRLEAKQKKANIESDDSVDVAELADLRPGAQTSNI